MAPVELQFAQQHGAMPRNANAAVASSAPQNTTAVIIGASVGAVILLACVFITARIVRTRLAYKKAIAAMEEVNEIPRTSRQDMCEAPRPVNIRSASRCRTLNTPSGWDSLGSHHSKPQAVAVPGTWQSSTGSMSERVSSCGMPWRPFRHLSVIIESAREQQESMPRSDPETALNRTFGPRHDQIGGDEHTYDDNNTFAAPDAPKTAAMPSFAVRSPRQYGIAITNYDHPAKAPRSVSAFVLRSSVSDNAIFSSVEPMPNMSKRRGPPLHIRTVSLGAPPSRPPTGPVPPLPVISPLETEWEEARKGFCISRVSSSSSNGSMGSSVLVVSPNLQRQNTDDPVTSPTVGELVDDDNGALRTVIKYQWQDPPVTGPRPISTMNDGSHVRAPSSVRGTIVRSSTDNAWAQHLRQISSISINSCESGPIRLSIPKFGTAERVSLSRVSSSNSLASGGIQKITTPTKRARRRSSVSVNGSPAERRGAGALRAISGNAVVRKNMPRREPSQSSMKSNRSSNGNPFHLDAQSSNVLPKPSALKGSPNARKSHKRQKSCVRISTLTPEVLGPPRSRPTSPAGLMDRIKEERESDEMIRQPSRRETSMYLAQGARPPNASAASNKLRIHTLRASLTPSSPTLSTWNAYQDGPSLPSQHSHFNSTNSPVSPISMDRPDSRQSDRSFPIPKFPSPARKSQATISPIAIDTAPMPEFAPACPASDEADETHSSSPFDLAMSCEGSTPVDIPSSPPVRLPQTQEYDPAWPMISFAPTIPASSEYDPASPPSTVVDNEMRSSLFLPFAIGNMPHLDEVSRPTSYTAADSPPCSPKTIPADLDLLSIPPKNSRREERRESQKLTSENASTIMSRSKTAPLLQLGTVPVPILAPTTQYDEDQDLPRYVDVSLEEHQEEEEEITPRCRVARAPSLSTIPQSSSPPPQPTPRDRTTSPMGPRAAPAQSVIKNAAALRRMNSEVNCNRPTRESRTYVRLGREASPLLPWVPTNNNDNNELFDFDFSDTATSTQTTPGKNATAMDEIDIESFDRQIDGALKGFDAEWRKENEAPKASSVWDDGEAFWNREEQRTSGEEEPAYTHVKLEKEEMEMVIDPRLLSTPTGGKRNDGQRSSQVGATPKSLYDNDGFLRA